jgi:large subunit ribosomal protein LP0
VVAVALETDITFPAVEQLKAYLEDPTAFAAAGPAASGGGGGEVEEEKQEEKQEEEEEESDDDMGLGLFD